MLLFLYTYKIVGDGKMRQMRFAPPTDHYDERLEKKSMSKYVI